ncbi:hypothetical protein [Streptomyces ficellus]|uniref:Lipoprotein n=1 Tax=Streptomyces ficellus TaxID=1977088 RepID=A0A6I6F2U6_9ACTN|nr:hypothetical protein [Streptomyces ficellus]QGV77990.1 hypothetical protein EIZ62_06785 [Streptomyces ficellus]
MRKTAPLLALLLAALTATGCSALETDYPSGDPEVLHQRLTDRAQWAYDGMALPPHKAVTPSTVDPGHSCMAGGFTIEESLPDVVTYELRWEVEGIPAEVARTTEARLRKRFTSAGWTVTHLDNRKTAQSILYGFVVKDPATGDQFHLDWNNHTTTLFLTGYTPCARVPQEAADHPSRETWTPRTG